MKLVKDEPYGKCTPQHLILCGLDPELFDTIQGYTPFQMEELAIRLEHWSKQLHLRARAMHTVPLMNN